MRKSLVCRKRMADMDQRELRALTFWLNTPNHYEVKKNQVTGEFEVYKIWPEKKGVAIQ